MWCSLLNGTLSRFLLIQKNLVMSSCGGYGIVNAGVDGWISLLTTTAVEVAFIGKYLAASSRYCILMADLNFVNLLTQLTVADNASRQSAEAQYATLKSDVNSIPFALLACGCDTSVDTHIRQLSIVLLRRLLIEEEESIFNRMNKNKLVVFL